MAEPMTGINIFDLPAGAFMGALEELGVGGSDREALIAQYRANLPEAQFSEFLDQVPPEMKRRMILPISTPEGMSGGEALLSGNFEFAVPELLSMFYQIPFKGVEATGTMGRGLPVSDQEQENLATGIAALGVGQTGIRIGKPLYNPNVASMFYGRGAKNAPTEALDAAKQLFDEGFTPQEIFDITRDTIGTPITVTASGKPLWEVSTAADSTAREITSRISDVDKEISKLQYRIDTSADLPIALAANKEALRGKLTERSALNKQEKLLREQVAQVGSTASDSLPEQVLMPALFDEYPDMKHASMRFDDYALPSKGYHGLARGRVGSPNTDISIAPNLPEYRGTPFHEVLHGIANVDPSVPQGANLGIIRDNASTYDRSRFAASPSDYLRIYAEKDTTHPLSARLLDDYIARLESADTMTKDAMIDNPTLRDMRTNPYKYYRATEGEQLARLTDYRKDMTPEQLAAESPMQTLDRMERGGDSFPKPAGSGNYTPFDKALASSDKADIFNYAGIEVDPYTYLPERLRDQAPSFRGPDDFPVHLIGAKARSLGPLVQFVDDLPDVVKRIESGELTSLQAASLPEVQSWAKLNDTDPLAVTNRVAAFDVRSFNDALFDIDSEIMKTSTKRNP